MRKKISIAASAIVLATGASAESSSLQDALSNGSFSGDFTLYSEQIDNDSPTKNAGFTMGSIGLGYETDSFHNFKGALGFRANHDLHEKEVGDYSLGDEPKAVMHTANISYENDRFALILGRQEIDLEWMSDFHEAYVGVLKSIPDTTVVAGHTVRMAAQDPDAALEDFADVNQDHGANVLDITYEGISDLRANAYYYNAKDLADWYGAKLDYDNAYFGVTAHYAQSSEDVTGTQDGGIAHAELRSGFKGFGFAGGYISTDSKGAIGSMDAVGENINPLEDGNRVYALDADTYYLSASYEIASVVLSAIYGDTDYTNGALSEDEQELNVVAEYAFDDTMNVSALYANVDAHASGADYDKLMLTAVYSF